MNLSSRIVSFCRRFTTLVLVLAGGWVPTLASAQTGSSASGEALRGTTYVGTWSGTVRCIHDPGLWPADECDRRFTIDIGADTVRVRQVVRSKRGQETAGDVGEGKWGFFRLETNAIAVAMDAGDDAQGHFVETWTFAMTLKEPDRMLVHWTRVVNNTDLPRTAKTATISIVGMGELVRGGR